MYQIIVAGINGKMGQSILQESKNYDVNIIGFDYNDKIPDIKADLWIDFSSKEGVINHLLYCKDKNIPFLTGVTGFSDKEIEKIKSFSEFIPVFLDYNMSIGINVIAGILKEMQKMLDEYDIELIETHHRYKKDSPSGTAEKFLAVLNDNRDFIPVNGRKGDSLREKKEIGVHSIRLGGVVGEHEIRFGNDLEEVYIGHRALQRATLALGALKAGLWLINKPSGFYSMASFLKDI